jgi:DNA-binding transcriptional regulator YiaG
MNAQERTAWKLIQAPDIRTHDPVLKRTVRKREIFRGHLRLNSATGCWLWNGPTDRKGRARVYVHGMGTSSNSRSAFVWMLEQWFPGVELPDESKGTVTTCGSVSCLSPFHRQKRGYEHVTKLNPATVRELYALRNDRLTCREVARRYGMGDKTIWDLWTGRTHRDITGAKCKEPKYRKLTPEDVLAIYRRKGTRMTQAEVGTLYNVTRETVSRIWSGRSWSEVTGAVLSEKQTV